MHFSFSILVPQKEIKKMCIQECFVEWAGKVYSQDPPKYKYGSITFKGAPNTIKYYNHIPDIIKIKTEYITLYPENNLINTMRIQLYKNSLILENCELLSLMKDLHKTVDDFFFICEAEDEVINQFKVTSDPLSAFSLLIESLTPDKEEGIIIRVTSS